MNEKNIEWYGTLPKNWSTPKMSYICNTITDYTASGSFASLAENVIYRDTEDYAMLVRTADLSRKRDINPVFIDEKAYNFLNNSNLFGGELIMSNVGSVGEVYLYEPLYKKASLAPNAIMVRANGYEKFLFYLFSTKQAVKGLLSITNTTTQPKFNKTQLRSFKVPFSDQLTTEKIVKHLDKKIQQIEEVENTINQEIENLENYKKSVITEAVTKGLDKNVEMKDSGIEWIGEIPKHWDLIKLKFIAHSISKGISPHYVEETLTPVVNQATFSKGFFDSNLKYCSEKPIGEGLLKMNDVLLATTGGGVLGKTYYFEEKGKYLASTDVAYIRNKDKYISKFIYYILSVNYDLLNGIFAKGSTNQTHLQMDLLSNMHIPLPNQNELSKIISKLDVVNTNIDDSIAIKQKQLETLEEYKKSLIYEYVTGKKEVKDGEET